MTSRSELLIDLLRRRQAVDFEELRAALGNPSPSTVFRHLKEVPYRSSYNFNGRFYALHEPDRYDRWGLFSVGEVHFSVDDTLKATVTRLVREAPAGWTQRELQDLLRLRVQPFLLEAVREGAIDREQIDLLFVYLHAAAEVRQEQLRRRQELIDRARQVDRLDDETVIRILLVLIRYAGASPGEVVGHLKGRSPPVTRVQVDVVFSRFGLGEKGGPRIY
jgi:hypothetical protein